ncbi:MAG: TSCPD domain-containing protein [Magnetococcales bacterium]|nr:TSCPD domain-containing protein [Magnetococcales bacterium]
MAVNISKKIVSYEVVTDAPVAKAEPAKVEEKSRRKQEAAVPPAKVIQMQPLLERSDKLEGVTYKVTTPLSEHALYITINDIIVSAGTEFEHRRPFEIFINSKNMDNFAWIVALTRVLSAVFRNGGDVTFLVEELRSVFDPRGGYFKPGGKYMPSLVAEIGECIEKHLQDIGMLRSEVTEDLKAKRRMAAEEGLTGSTQCPKCAQMAVVQLDGCDTCLECGFSKCG